MTVNNVSLASLSLFSPLAESLYVISILFDRVIEMGSKLRAKQGEAGSSGGRARKRDKRALEPAQSSPSVNKNLAKDASDAAYVRPDAVTFQSMALRDLSKFDRPETAVSSPSVCVGDF